MSVGQLTVASVVIFCFGLSVLGGVDFEKVKSNTKGRGNIRRYFIIFLDMFCHTKDLGCQGKAEVRFPFWRSLGCTFQGAWLDLRCKKTSASCCFIFQQSFLRRKIPRIPGTALRQPWTRTPGPEPEAVTGNSSLSLSLEVKVDEDSSGTSWTSQALPESSDVAEALGKYGVCYKELSLKCFIQKLVLSLLC